jgi:hypothetical protein
MIAAVINAIIKCETDKSIMGVTTNHKDTRHNGLLAKFSISNTRHRGIHDKVSLSVVILSIIMLCCIVISVDRLSVITLSVITLSVITLSVITLSVISLSFNVPIVCYSECRYAVLHHAECQYKDCQC